MTNKSFLIMLGIMGAITLFVIACAQKQEKLPAVRSKKKELSKGSIAALPLEVKHPADNPFSVEKAELGRLLFYDPVLSGDKDVSCATCHHPDFGYAESLELSIGVGGKGLGLQRKFAANNGIPFTKRNSQSVLNTGFNGIDENGNYDPNMAPMFWDLRAKGLEAQSLHPIRQLEEMRGRHVREDKVLDVVITRLKAIPEYRARFRKAFGDSGEINEANLAKAIACFERTLISNNSRFDQYMRGDVTKLSIGEKEGMELFLDAGCARCHSGPMFSDFKVHVVAAPDADKRSEVDSGFEGSFAFRTPSLRNLRFSGPYMHSGKIGNLTDVLSFYEDLRGNTLRTRHVEPSDLDTLAKLIRVEFKDISRIVEFLNTLNDGGYDKKIPATVPSGLPVGGYIERKL
ncbi:MAG TPA: cytochrome-c peroxidase [Chitinophagaceae bacterium]|nr:cytochrome-c peroxidase [Chitinophagaceae bacterium]